MGKIVFEKTEFQQQYDARIAELKRIAQSPALTKEILWDKTAARYAETIAKVKLLLSEQD